MSNSVLADLVALSRTLGRPESDLAILAEGNASIRYDQDHFYVKASGYSMNGIDESGFSLVRFAPILLALEGPDLGDSEVRALLSECRQDAETMPRPSVETFMHAFLLSLPGVSVIGHTHPTPLISLLSLAGCERFATQRLFPDEVVCCGPATAFVPYADPGLPLARAIRASVQQFVVTHGSIPKTIWMQNHGLIALGKTVGEIESASLMSIKAARAWLGALSTGLPLSPLSDENINRIHSRPDEHYRQELINAMNQPNLI